MSYVLLCMSGGQLTREDSTGSITQEFGCIGDKTDGSARVPKIKVGVGNTVLAEMKARQEKRTSSPRQVYLNMLFVCVCVCACVRARACVLACLHMCIHVYEL
jgi:hypothetical protein